MKEQVVLISKTLRAAFKISVTTVKGTVLDKSEANMIETDPCNTNLHKKQ